MTRLSRRGPWLPEEDGALIELVRTQGPNNWVRISQQLQHRSPKQCRERYHQNLKPSLNHEPITTHEGEVIEQLVNEMGKRWAEIARRLGNRSDNAVKNWWNGSMNRRKRNPLQTHNPNRSLGTRQAVSFVKHQRDERDQLRQLHPAEPTGLLLQHPTTQPQFIEQGHDPFLSIPSMPQTQAEQHCIYTRASHEVGDTASRVPFLRLPPLKFSDADNMQPLVDRPSVSPATSEFAYSMYGRQAPSLISDAQSSYSISPKTIASPRLSLPPSWPSERPSSGDYHGVHGQLALSPLDIGTIRLPEIGSKQLPYNYPETQSEHLSRYSSYKEIPSFSTHSVRDSRMHVSSLVQ